MTRDTRQKAEEAWMGGGEGETAEKEVVYYRYLCEPNLYCIKISG